jgi:phage repressor protein C with HTH and peptisase S24 domain
MSGKVDRGLPPGVLRRLKEKVFAAGDYASLSVKSGIPLGTLQKMMRGASEPRFSAVVELARTLGLSLDYLVTGIEPDNSSGDWETPLGPSPVGEKRVPVRSIAASAGHGLDAFDEDPVYWLTFPVSMLMALGDPDHLDIISVSGDSMAPDLFDGDMAMIDQSQRSIADGLYVLLVDERLFLKRVVVRGRHRAELVSTNPAYPPFEVNIDNADDEIQQDGARIIGRVVWVGRSL